MVVILVRLPALPSPSRSACLIYRLPEVTGGGFLSHPLLFRGGENRVREA